MRPPWSVARLYAPVFTKARIEALHAEMSRRGLDSHLGQWLDRLGDTPDPEPVTKVEVSATIGRGRDALRAHRTQVDPDGPWFQVPEEVVLAAYPFEDFELMASREAPDDDDDLFAGITPGD